MITDTLAMAVCMQLSEAYDDLMKRFNYKNFVPLKFNTYDKVNQTWFVSIQRDQNASKLYDSIVRKYAEYANILKSRKYNK